MGGSLNIFFLSIFFFLLKFLFQDELREMIKSEYAIIDGTTDEAKKKEEEDNSTVVDKE